MKENSILEDAKQILHETFSNEFFNLMENVLNSNGVSSFSNLSLKTLKQNKLNFCVFILLLLEINSDKKDEALNFILPGCLYPFKDDICRMFAGEKLNFLANKRFNAIFSNTTLIPPVSKHKKFEKK